jgi:hypothetical protein
VTFFEGSTTAKTSSDPPQQIVFSYPLAYNFSFARGLAFGGFSWQINYNISFAVHVVPTGNMASDTIEFEVLEDLTVYFISFYLLLVDPTSGEFHFL